MKLTFAVFIPGNGHSCSLQVRHHWVDLISRSTELNSEACLNEYTHPLCSSMYALICSVHFSCQAFNVGGISSMYFLCHCSVCTWMSCVDLWSMSATCWLLIYRMSLTFLLFTRILEGTLTCTPFLLLCFTCLEFPI